MSNRVFQLPLLTRHLEVVRSTSRKLPPAAHRQHKGKRSPLWYALYLPQLAADQEKLTEVASLLTSLSATVSIEPPDAFTFEVRSTLKYFGGIQKIRNRVMGLLNPQLQAWGLPEGFAQAVSPTPAASLLLARAGCNALIHRQDNLRSALGRLSVQALPLPADKKKQLHNTGLRVLRDIWRLPAAGLGQRFGPDFVRQLERCLGTIASPVKAYESAPRFSTSVEFEFAVENTRMLMHSVEELLARLCDFLRQRELAATHLTLVLLHEYQEQTSLSLDLRQPTRSETHLALLLDVRINALLLPAPVTGIKLEVQHFAPFTGQTAALRGIEPGQTNAGDNTIIPLLEQLQARLGNSAVRTIFCADEHCPEYAGQDGLYEGGAARTSSHPAQSPGNPRPCWLLPEPQALEQVQGKLLYRGGLRLLSGPERIETRWWTGQEVRRDYYVARNRHGMRLWIFHERTGERRWYLHGIFD